MSYDDKITSNESHYKIIAIEFAAYLLKSDAMDSMYHGTGLPQFGRREKLAELYNEFLLQRKQL